MARLQDKIVLLNPVAEPRKVWLYAADGVPSVGGGYGYTLRGKPVSRIGAWVHLPAAEVTVPGRGDADASGIRTRRRRRGRGIGRHTHAEGGHRQQPGPNAHVGQPKLLPWQIGLS